MVREWVGNGWKRVETGNFSGEIRKNIGNDTASPPSPLLTAQVKETARQMGILCADNAVRARTRAGTVPQADG